jgi:epsilon-lactone hydrolase
MNRTTASDFITDNTVGRAAALLLVFGVASAFPDTPPPTTLDQAATTVVPMDGEGTVRLPAFDVPLSAALSPEARQAFLDLSENPAAQARRELTPASTTEDILQYRATMDKELLGPLADASRKRYAVTVEEQFIDGVRTDVIRPRPGIGPGNQNRVLINLHGGAFRVGGGLGGLVESVPVAAVAAIEVISVDYRQWPEHTYPAATEDVVKVYRALLERYAPENVGIYGCSAGGLLTAEAVAWFQKESLPRPGAIGIFCAGAGPFMGMDSTRFAMSLDPFYLSAPRPVHSNPGPRVLSGYMTGADPDDPLVFPGLSAAILEQFPPTLIITGTRDMALSSAVTLHIRLSQVEVDARLYVWEGLWHAFIYNSDLPESREAYNVIARFFNAELGR